MPIDKNQSQSRQEKILYNLQRQLVPALIAVIMIPFFFSNWFSFSFFIISLEGSVTEIVSILKEVVNLLNVEIERLDVMLWVLRAYYLIPITQVIYIAVLLSGSRRSNLFGRIAAGVSFLFSAAYLLGQTVLDRYLQEQLGSSPLNFKIAPLMLLIFSILNFVLLIVEKRKSKNKV